MYSRIAILIAFALGCSALAQYRIIDIGTLGGPDSSCRRINEMGQVVGWSSIPHRDKHAVIWDNGVLRDLGSGYYDSEAWDLNDSGTVVGWTETNAPYMDVYPAIWLSSGQTLLQTLMSQSGASINSTSTIACCQFQGSAWSTFTYAGGVITPYSIPGSIGADAFRINERGEITGTVNFRSGSTITAMAYRGRPGNFEVCNDYYESVAYDNNDSGVVVGYAKLSYNGVTFPMMWGQTTTLFTDLPQGWDAASFFAINANGDCVGAAIGPIGQIGFVYKNGVFTDLNDFVPQGSSFIINAATDIADSGEICGWGSDANFHGHGYVLVPSNSYWGQGVPVQVPVTTCVPTVGSFVSGSALNLPTQDDNWLILRPGLVFSHAADPVQVVASGICPIAAPSVVSFVMESALPGPAGRFSLSFRNFATGQWDMLRRSDTTTSDQYQQLDVGPGTAAQYVQTGTGLMQARLTWRSTSGFGQYPWMPRIDFAMWRCRP